MPITRSQQGELGVDFLRDERLAEHEADDQGEQYSEGATGLEVLREIKHNQDMLKPAYKRILDENRAFVERLESQDTVRWIDGQANLENRMNNLETQVEQLTVSSRSYKEIEGQVETSRAEFRNVHTYFTESFESLLSAVEGLDKELHSAVADLQGKVTDISKLCLPKTPVAKSTEMKTDGRGWSLNETLRSSRPSDDPSLAPQ